MKNFILSLLFFFLAINTLHIYTQQKDTSYIYLYDNEIPQGFYLEEGDLHPFSPVTKIRFGLADTSLVIIEIYDIDGKMNETNSKKLKGGNYIYDWGHLFFKEDFKSGIYFVKINAVIDKIVKDIAEMTFEGRTKFLLVK